MQRKLRPIRDGTTFLQLALSQKLKLLSLYASTPAWGLPSSDNDYLEDKIDLNRYLAKIQRPPS